MQHTLNEQTAVSAAVHKKSRGALGIKSLLAVTVGLVVSQGSMVIMLQGVGLAGAAYIIPLTIAWILARNFCEDITSLSCCSPPWGTPSILHSVFSVFSLCLT